MEKMSFTKAIVQFFGKKPNQTASELSVELKALSEQDKADLKAEFAKIGIEIE